ncbi:MAG: AMP-binding protein, partial [Porticoccus sp.]
MVSNESVTDVAEAVRCGQQRFGVPESLPPSEFNSLLDVLQQTVEMFPQNPALTALGHTTDYAELDRLSTIFAAYIQQKTDLKPGDRLAIQMPSVTQYLVVAYGAFKAGLAIVNINPLYTEVELEYQFNHADVKAVVVFDKFLPHVEAVREKTQINDVFVTSPFDLHPPVKRLLMSTLLKLMGKSVAPGTAIPLREVLNSTSLDNYQPVSVGSGDMALLQYTGGTTGVSKPAIISHGNLVSVTRQGWELLRLADTKRGEERIVSPLPLYHIYAFALVATIGIYMGAH